MWQVLEGPQETPKQVYIPQLMLLLILLLQRLTLAVVVLLAPLLLLLLPHLPYLPLQLHFKELVQTLLLVLRVVLFPKLCPWQTKRKRLAIQKKGVGWGMYRVLATRHCLRSWQGEETMRCSSLRKGRRERDMPKDRATKLSHIRAALVCYLLISRQ